MNEKGNMYAIAALRDKRATIASEIVQLERQLRHKRENLVHVDATLAILDPDFNPEAIPNKRVVKHINLFRSGELSRLIMDAFRVAEGEAMSTREIAETVMRQQRLGDDARKAITNRVRQNLAYQVKMGRVVKIGEGTTALWMLADRSCGEAPEPR